MEETPNKGTENDGAISGNLALTGILEVLSHLSSGEHTGVLRVTKMPEELVASFFYRDGSLIAASCEQDSGEVVVHKVRGWSKGFFRFERGVQPPEPTARAAANKAENREEANLHEAASPATEQNGNIEGRQTERSSDMEQSSTQIMEDMLKIPGINTVTVIGRDGFVIESVGSGESINLDSLGASLAAAVNGIEEMGSELEIDVFEDLFIEYGKAVIICRPLGDSVVAMLAPDASKLGIIRHKVKKPLALLAQLF